MDHCRCMRILFGFVILPLIVSTALWFALRQGLLNSIIEDELKKRTGQEVELGGVELWPLWPPQIGLKNSKVIGSWGEATWRSLDIQVNPIVRPIRVDIEWKNPVLVIHPRPEQDALPQAAKDQGEVKVLIVKNDGPPVSIGLRIVQGQVRQSGAVAESVNLEFEQKSVLQSPASFTLTADVGWPGWPKQALFVETKSLSATSELIKTSQAVIRIGGLEADLQGASYWQESRHRWLIKLNAPDLSQVKAPSDSLPAKNWKGAVVLDAEVVQPGPDQPWQVDALFDLKAVSADVDYKSGEASAKGRLNLEAQGKIRRLGQETMVPKLNASLDMTGLALQAKDILHKPSGVPLRVSAKLSGDNTQVQIEEFNLQFWKIQAQALGTMRAKSPYFTKLTLKIPEASLAGLEKFVLPLAKQPVQGQLALSALGQFKLFEPAQGTWNVSQLKARGLSANIGFERPESGFLLKGPFAGQLDGEGQWLSGKLGPIRARGAVNLSKLQLKMGPFSKSPTQNLEMGFDVDTKGSLISLNRMDISSFFGEVKSKGRYDYGKAAMDLDLSLSKIDLSALRGSLADLSSLIPSGKLDGHTRVRGTYKSDQPWYDQPIRVAGKVTAVLPDYEMAQASPPKPAAGAPGNPEPTNSDIDSGVLPSGKLTRAMNLSLNLQIERFKAQSLKIGKIGFQGRMANSIFQGRIQLGEIFGGSLEFPSFRAPLFTRKKPVAGQLKWKDLDIEMLLSWMKPEFKSLAKGKTSGSTAFSSPWPNDPELANNVILDGQARAKPVELSTLKITEAIGEKLEKIPGVGKQKIKSEPFQGEIEMKYKMKAGSVDLRDFVAKESSGHQLDLDGSIRLVDLASDLKGNFHWSNSPIKGCVLEGNSDPQGRFVVPVVINGPLVSPRYDVLSGIVEKVASRALKCEKEKLEKQLKSKVKSKVENEIQKRLKGIMGK